MSIITQIEALENGKGFQYLLDAAFEIIHNPLIIFDVNYKLIAYTDTPVDDFVWNEITAIGEYSMSTIRFFADEYFTEYAANAEKSTRLKSNKLKYVKWLGYVYNKEKVKIAALVMYEANILHIAECISAFNILLDKLTLEIKDDESYVDFGRANQEGFINKILDGIINEPLLYTPQVQILYDGFEDFLYIAVIDISQSNFSDNSPANIKKILLDLYSSFKFAVYSGYIVMIMSSENRKIDEKLIFNMQNNFFIQNNLYVGISGSFENLYELREYYDKAVKTLKKGIIRDNGRRIFYCDR